MNSVEKARVRLKALPKLIAECGNEAAMYGRCISVKENLKKNDCQKEFEGLKNCLIEAGKKVKV